MELNSSPLECGLFLVTCFQRLEYGVSGGDTITAEKPGKHYLSQVIKFNIISDKSCC